MVSPRVNLAVSRSAGVDHARIHGLNALDIYIYPCSTFAEEARATCRVDGQPCTGPGVFTCAHLAGVNPLHAADEMTCSFRVLLRDWRRRLFSSLRLSHAFCRFTNRLRFARPLRDTKLYQKNETAEGKGESFKFLNKENGTRAFVRIIDEHLVQISLRVCIFFARNYKLLILIAQVILRRFQSVRWVRGKFKKIRNWYVRYILLPRLYYFLLFFNFASKISITSKILNKQIASKMNMHFGTNDAFINLHLHYIFTWRNEYIKYSFSHR